MHRYRFRGTAWSLVVGFVIASGCGKESVSGRPKLVPVAGRVLVKDKPSEGCRVVFFPKDHQFAAAAVTDSQGRFQLTTFDAQDGAVPGNYTILVSNFKVIDHADGSVTEIHHLPEKYRDPAKCGLTATIREDGANEIDVELVE